MKNKAISLGIILILIIAGGIVSVQAAKDKTGNGAPSGYHYTLNILGKDWDKKESIPQNQGHRIFVGLGKNEMCKTKILLQVGEFGVIDCDGTDGQAKFQLPKPYSEDDTDFSEPAYTVWIRVQSPKGHALMYTTFNDSTTWIESQEKITLDENGRKKFQDYTRELTTITADLDGDGNVETVGLFDDDWEGLWAWDYDNYGLKHIQIRFYPA